MTDGDGPFFGISRFLSLAVKPTDPVRGSSSKPARQEVRNQLRDFKAPLVPSTLIEFADRVVLIEFKLRENLCPEDKEPDIALQRSAIPKLPVSRRSLTIGAEK